MVHTLVLLREIFAGSGYLRTFLATLPPAGTALLGLLQNSLGPDRVLRDIIRYHPTASHLDKELYGTEQGKVVCC